MTKMKPAILNVLERKFILLLGDIGIVFVCLRLFINDAIDEQFYTDTLLIVLYVFGFIQFVLLSYVLDFYNLNRVSNRKLMFSQSLYVVGLYVLSILLFTLLVYDVSFWRIPLLAFLFLSPFVFALWRFFFANLFRVIPVTKNVLYLYDEEKAEELKEHQEYIDGKDDVKTYYKVKAMHEIDKAVPSEKKRSFVSTVEKVDTIIINTKNYESINSDLEKQLLNGILLGKEVIPYISFYENTYEALPIKSNYDSFYEILQLRPKKIRYLQLLFSFLIDFSLCALVGLVFLLSCPFVWILNFIFNPGPLFYTQLRVGKYGKEYKIYKFRSMVVNAEKTGAVMASKGDSRITPFGKILRMFRIDELPQVISVIKGDMKFIGPRPERKVFVDKLNERVPFYNARHLIRPGITGWAQVKYKYGENLDDSITKLEYDLYYIKNRSITLDIRILFKTVTTILFSRGL